jgi:translation initiation factor 2B subunit (eIF-2B alpha/beta/delta family)
MNKERTFNKILKDIKEIKIQGARNIAKKALYAYFLIPTKESKRKLLSSRPTEPMMENVLDLAEKKSHREILKHFDEAQEKINKSVLKLIKKDDVIFTHCHSTNVVNALIYSKKKGKKFEVYNTETRPLFQGRKTAKELKRAGIKITMFVDSALGVALSKEQGTKKVDKVFLGADALLKTGIINKIGSGVICQIAKNEKIPIYIVADSWKFTKSKIPIEQRELNEVWDNAPKKIKIKNPAFEFVDKKYIAGIITEFGLQKYGDFVRKMN